MPGPPPKPAAIRRREGNPSRRPIIDEARVGTDVVSVESFPPPQHLPAAAVEVWREVMPDLVEIGLVRSIDATVIEALCRAVARAREAEQVLDAEGIYVQGARGMVTHPATRVADSSWRLALKIAEQYGMTAVGRLRVGAAVLAQKTLADELRDFFDAPDDGDVIEGEVVEVGIADVLAELDDEPKPKPRPRKKKQSR